MVASAEEAMTDTDLLSSPDLRALFAAVEASPMDGLPKGVLADWLDEHGEHSLAAVGAVSPTGGDQRVRGRAHAGAAL